MTIESKFKNLEFFTIWGLIFLCLTFTLFSFSTLKEMRKKERYFDYYSPFILEKWVVVIFVLGVSYEFVITIVFWGLLYAKI